MECAIKFWPSSYFSVRIVFNPENSANFVGRHFDPSSLLLTTKNFGSASENLDDLWLEYAGLGSRRHIA